MSRSAPQQIIELCAGTAAVSLAALGAPRFPVSRVGSKAGYADAILELMGIKPGSVKSAVLVEADPKMAKALDSLSHIPGAILSGYRSRLSRGTERQAWDAANGGDTTADFLIRMAGARGGVGGYRGVHKLRPNAPTIPGVIERRIAAFCQFALEQKDVKVLCEDVSWNVSWRLHVQKKLNPVVYIDPPYLGRMGIGVRFYGTRIEDVAARAARTGLPVYVSEGRPLEGADWSEEITNKRRGQNRRSLTTSNAEFISYFRPMRCS